MLLIRAKTKRLGGTRVAWRGGLCSHGQCAVDPIRSLQQQSHVRVLDVQGGHGVNGSGQLPKTVSNSQKANARPILRYRSRTQRPKTRHLQQPSPKSHLPASVARHPVVGPPNPSSAVTAPIWVEERETYICLSSHLGPKMPSLFGCSIGEHF